MDPITQILLTVGLNALITGVFIYAFQKRMDARYAKRMFEDQVKFQRLYEKRVQVLETLHTMYLDFVATLQEIMKYGHRLLETQRRPEKSNVAEISQRSMKKLDEVKEYVKANNLYLSDESDLSLYHIFERAKLVHELAILVINAKSNEDLDESFMGRLTPFGGHGKKDKFLILHTLSGDLNFQAGMISALYKSIADAEYKSSKN